MFYFDFVFFVYKADGCIFFLHLTAHGLHLYLYCDYVLRLSFMVLNDLIVCPVSFLSKLPFYNLSNNEFCKEFVIDRWNTVFKNYKFGDYIRKVNSGSVLKILNLKYLTPEELNTSVSKTASNICISVFHLNVRSLTSKHSQLCQLLSLINLEFDVIVFTEIWVVNIEYLANIFPGYSFYCDLSRDSKIGGVVLFVKNTLNHQEISWLKINSTSNNIVESKWLEIQSGKRKYIVGGIYRHPNETIAIFLF